MIKTQPVPPATPRSPFEIDSNLADVLYTDRRHELTSFFYRRTRSGDITSALLAQTFATAAQIRMKRPEKSEHDNEWLTSIATLELSRYFRAGSVSDKAVVKIGLEAPELSGSELARLEEELRNEAAQRPSIDDEISDQELALH